MLDIDDIFQLLVCLYFIFSCDGWDLNLFGETKLKF